MGQIPGTSAQEVNKNTKKVAAKAAIPSKKEIKSAKKTAKPNVKPPVGKSKAATKLGSKVQAKKATPATSKPEPTAPTAPGGNFGGVLDAVKENQTAAQAQTTPATSAPTGVVQDNGNASHDTKTKDDDRTKAKTETTPKLQPPVEPQVKADKAPVEAPAAKAADVSAPVTQTTTPKAPRIKLISNVFTDTDIKAVIQEMCNSSGATIIADTSVKGMEINIEFKKDTVDSALEKLAYAGNLLWKKKGDIYIVTTSAPDSPLFSEFAETKVYNPHTQPAENLFGLLTRNFTLYAQLDKAAGLISVTAPPKQMEAIMKALAVADEPKKQFAVEAMVTEMNTQAIKNAGFSWNWQYFAQGSDLSFTYAAASASDLVNIKAMITNNKAELRANPKVIASEGHEATINVGNETYFPLVTGTGQTQSIQYQKIVTGITLKFTGYIESDGMVNLHIQPEVSDAVQLVNGVPQTTVRKADTYLRVRFGETIALGGMMVTNTTNNVNKLPILGDIPIVGQAFRSSSKEKDTREVVILITPRLILDSVKTQIQ
jgi:hypothetical protein